MSNRLGIKGYRCVRRVETQQLDLHVRPTGRPRACRHCGHKRLRSKGRYQRRVRHLESLGRESRLLVDCQRFVCQSVICGRSFVEPLPGILPGRHSSEPFREQIYVLHHEGIPGSVMARLRKLGAATVERIYAQFTRRKASQRESLRCPAVLGLDEHTLHKKQRFATTFCDLRNHRIFDVVPGKSREDLAGFLATLQGRDKVKVVCIDLSSAYRALVRQYFPNAKIVADRFHVVRIVLHHFLELAKDLVPELNARRGHFALLRTNPGNLSPAQQARLTLLLGKYPVLGALYKRLRQLLTLLGHKHQSKWACKPLIGKLLAHIADLKASGFAPMLTLASTLQSWSAEIATMWRFTKNNGITEGFHRKMKLIQRRAYGFKNFANYRLRVLAACG